MLAKYKRHSPTNEDTILLVLEVRKEERNSYGIEDNHVKVSLVESDVVFVYDPVRNKKLKMDANLIEYI